MSDFSTLKSLISTLDQVTEEPHFEKTSFRIKKKIFATYNPAFNRTCVKLSQIDQEVFVKVGKGAIYPVDNKWGKQGWTLIDLNTVEHDLLKDALETAYCEVAPLKLADALKAKYNL